MWPEPGVSFDGNCMEASVILVEAIFVAMTWPIKVSLRTEEWEGNSSSSSSSSWCCFWSFSATSGKLIALYL